jgi:bifunctional N-acetylglucosamine-1-phosphate-uridyltransferase/glucosamine-1-phosphate-acetyltransferase GlmU-like protein
MNQGINEKELLNGNSILDSDTIIFDDEVKWGINIIIYPETII